MIRAVLLALAACGRPPAPPAPRPVPPADAAPAIDAPLALADDLPQLARRAVALYEAIRRALERAGEDCAAATAAVDAITAANRDVIDANAAVVRGPRAGELRDAVGAHGDALDQAALAIMMGPTLAACARDAGFRRAFDQLIGTPPLATSP
jgi:hypothetical protein